VDIARAHNAYGICMEGLLRLDEANGAFAHALDIARRNGDDARASTVAANLCLIENLRGHFDDALKIGLLSIELGTRATSQPEMNNTYTNLADTYMLLSQRENAAQCMEAAREWLTRTKHRSWRANAHFLMEGASLALMSGNTNLALDLTGEVERLVGNRHRALADPSMFEKLQVFRAGHLHGYDAAAAIARAGLKRYQSRHPYSFLNLLAANAWVERTFLGGHSAETREGLKLLDRAPGKLALLRAQGFLD